MVSTQVAKSCLLLSTVDYGTGLSMTLLGSVVEILVYTDIHA